MNTFNLLAILRRSWLLILIITGVVFAIAYYLDNQRSNLYYGSLSVTVRALQPAASGSSNLILQTDTTSGTQLLIGTVQSWLADPVYVQQIFRGAGVGLSDESIKNYSKIFKIVQGAGTSATFQVEYTGKSIDEVSRVYASSRTVLTDLSNQYDQKESNGLKLDLYFSEPFITTSATTVPTLPLVGLLVGFLFALIIAALVRPR